MAVLPLIPSVPDDCSPRLRRCLQQLTELLNSLIRNGSITMTGAGEFTISSIGTGTDYQNTVISDVGVRTINEADNVSGIYNETAATPTRNVQKIYAAGYAQAGAVSTTAQLFAGEKGFDIVAIGTTGGTVSGSGGRFGFISSDVVGLFRIGEVPGTDLPTASLQAEKFHAPGVSGQVEATTFLSSSASGITRNFADGDLATVTGGIVTGYTASTTLSTAVSNIATLTSDLATLTTRVTALETLLAAGATGTFISADLVPKTVTVTGGITTAIV